MKRLIITTIILLIAAVGVTVVYFKNLNPQAERTSQIINTIPGNAAFVFELNNDSSFYDIFKDNKLFSSFIGKQAVSDLDTLRQQLLLNPQLSQFFTGQNIFISLHPQKNNAVDLLVTTSASKGFKIVAIDNMVSQQDNGLLIKAENIEGKKVYTIYSNILKKRFYLVNQEDDIFSGSFSKDLIIQSIKTDPKKNKVNFVLLPDQQNSNSLAGLYVNYNALNPLFEQLFANKNTDIFKNFRQFPGLSALSLNFKSDALMFSGLTDIPKNADDSYLGIFQDQQPVANKLKDIFPSTTAYSMGFGITDAAKFKTDLAKWQSTPGLQLEKDVLFKKVKAETGLNIMAEFNQLLNNEFAVVTTKYLEKLAIISIKDGSKIKPIIFNISTKLTDNTGQFNYNRLPFFLLGDAFNVFKRPYFMLIDNYLVLANSTNELASYYDTYINHKFLNKVDGYSRFDNLLAERSNVEWIINFKNTDPIFKRDMEPDFYKAFETSEPGWKNFYAASYQLSSSGKRFYTNFCMNLNLPDTTNVQMPPNGK